MTRSDLTHLCFLLDRSGSMESIKTDTEGGYAAFVGEQHATDGECLVTLAQFDDVYEVVFADRPVVEVAALALQPRGRTALLDAMGRLITETGTRLAALPEDERPGTVIVAIMTDGHENASQEWTRPAIRALVEQQSTAYGWEFLYLGADQDAVEVGRGLGVKAESSITYGRGKSAEAMVAGSDKVRRLREARTHDAAAPMPAFTAQERQDLLD